MDKDKISRSLRESGVPEEHVEAAAEAVVNLPEKTYNTAIYFLGGVTLLLALGAVVLPAFGNQVADALWGALGAGIGGLAGIFMKD